MRTKGIIAPPENAKTNRVQGQRVAIYALKPQELPVLEGYARIVSALDETNGLFEVAFLNEPGRICRRLVHFGLWQTDPEGVLDALTAHWRVATCPELLADMAFPGDSIPPPPKRR